MINNIQLIQYYAVTTIFCNVFFQYTIAESKIIPYMNLSLINKKKSLKKKQKGGDEQDGGRVGSPNHLSPPNYLENPQIILKIYQFGLRFKERPAGMQQ